MYLTLIGFLLTDRQPNGENVPGKAWLIMANDIWFFGGAVRFARSGSLSINVSNHYE
jgi:hypothetical protein